MYKNNVYKWSQDLMYKNNVSNKERKETTHVRIGETTYINIKGI